MADAGIGASDLCTGDLPAEATLYVPSDDESAPLVSIVVPAMDEEITIRKFVKWCHEGLSEAGVRGEILIADSSKDATPAIALSSGARVLRIPRRGLGQAYLDAVPFARGKYLILGDADCTYDFRSLGAFLDQLDSGADFVMGSRFLGSIERGAMPLHHRYVGTPVTTFVMNVLFGTHYSDIHCGMRAVTRDAFDRMRLQASGWEYASEMLVAASRENLVIAEVPIDFYRDVKGRESHVKRQGWLTPFRAGWSTLRVLFTNAADFFLLRVGVPLAVVGTALLISLAFGPISVGAITLTLHTQAMALALALLGWSAIGLGLVARAFYDASGDTLARWITHLPFSRTTGISAVVFLLGLALDALFLVEYVSQGLTVGPSAKLRSHLAVTGLFLMSISFIAFTTMLILHALAGSRARGGAE